MGFSDLGKKLSKLGQDTKNGVQKMSDSVSISNRISAEKNSLERLFASIGEAIYKESPDVPREGLEDEWAAVKVAYANIASLSEQLNHVKGIIYCPNCGRPASQGDKFCARCGFRLDNLHETTGSKMAQDIKEAGQEVGKMAGDAAGKTGELVGGAAADTKNFFTRLKDGASKFAKNAGEKFKGKIHEDGIETEDLSGAADILNTEDAGDSLPEEIDEAVRALEEDAAEYTEVEADAEADAAEDTDGTESPDAESFAENAREDTAEFSGVREDIGMEESADTEDGSGDEASAPVQEETGYAPGNGLAGDLGPDLAEAAAEDAVSAEAAEPAETEEGSDIG